MSSYVRQPIQRSDADADGFTVAELVVTVFVLAIVLAAVLGAFDNLTRVSRRGEATINNQDEVRRTVSSMERDIRGANLLLPVETLGQYPTTIRMRLGDTTLGGITFIQWRFEAASDTLVRESLAPDPLVPTALASPLQITGSRVMLRNVRNSDVSPNIVPFRYFDHLGNELTSALNTVRDFSFCTRRVKLSISSHPDQAFSSPPFVRSTDVQLRNGGGRC